MKTINDQQLKMLFDYQHIALNDKLSDIIAKTAVRYNLCVSGIELSDDELNLNAAGETIASKYKDKPNGDLRF